MSCIPLPDAPVLEVVLESRIVDTCFGLDLNMPANPQVTESKLDGGLPPAGFALASGREDPGSVFAAPVISTLYPTDPFVAMALARPAPEFETVVYVRDLGFLLREVQATFLEKGGDRGNDLAFEDPASVRGDHQIIGVPYDMDLGSDSGAWWPRRCGRLSTGFKAVERQIG